MFKISGYVRQVESLGVEWMLSKNPKIILSNKNPCKISMYGRFSPEKSPFSQITLKMNKNVLIYDGNSVLFFMMH